MRTTIPLRSQRWLFVGSWILVNALSGALGWILGERLGARLDGFYVGLCLIPGLTLLLASVGQWVVLRRWAGMNGLWALSGLGTLVLLGAGGWGILQGQAVPSLPFYRVLLLNGWVVFLSGILSGALIGLMQWGLLRLRLRYSALWILVQIVGGGGSAGLTHFWAWRIETESMGLLAGSLVGMISGLWTAVGLLILWRDPVPRSQGSIEPGILDPSRENGTLKLE